MSGTTSPVDGSVAGVNQGGTLATSLITAPYAPKLQLVGQRCGTNGWGPFSTIHNYSTSYQRIVFPNGADALQLVFANFYMDNSGNGEGQLPPSMFQATGVTYSGGTGYSVGQVDSFAVTSSTGIAPAKVMITAVDGSGVPTAVQVIDGGLFNTLPAAGVARSSTQYGSGSGATATFTWNAGVMGMHIGIDPLWGTQTTSHGTNCLQVVGNGKIVPLAVPTLDWNLLVPMGEFLVTPLTTVDIPVGGAIGVRMSAGYGSPWGGRAPMSASNSAVPSGNYETSSFATTFTEQANGSNGPISPAASGQFAQPIAVLGIPKNFTPSIIGFGDSRMAGAAGGLNAIGGVTDPMDTDGNIGWFEKALAMTGGLAWPWSNLSVTGDQIGMAVQTAFIDRFGRYKAIALARPTCVCLGPRVNDFVQSGATVASVQADEAQMIAEIKGMGVKYVCTMTTDPWTTSTDNYVTLVNQTLTPTASANIITHNTNLAAGTGAPFDFIIDNRSIVESAVNSGYWKVNGTAGYATGASAPNHSSPALNLLKAANAAAVFKANIKL